MKKKVKQEHKSAIDQYVSTTFWWVARLSLPILALTILAARLGQNTRDNGLATLAPVNAGSSASFLNLYQDYESICTSRAPGLFFSNRIPYQDTDTLYPYTCWQTDLGENRYGLNFTAKSKQDHERASANFTAIETEAVNSKSDMEYFMPLKNIYSMHNKIFFDELKSEGYTADQLVRMRPLVQLKQKLPADQLKHTIPLREIQNIIENIHLQYYIKEGIQCGTSVEYNIVRILFSNLEKYQSLKNAPHFLRLHFKLNNDEVDTAKSLTFKEHSTLILYKPGKLTERIETILAENSIYGDAYQAAMSGFSQARDQIIDLVTNSGEGLECDNWLPSVGLFPNHCLTQGNNTITHIQFFNFNDNALVFRFLKHFIKKYPEIYESYLEPGLTTKEAFIPKGLHL